MSSRREKFDAMRKRIVEMQYELYHIPGSKALARKIDKAVGKAAEEAIKKLATGMTLKEASMAALKEHVSPLLDSDFGAHDTEPEWHIVDVFTGLLSLSLGGDVDMDGWDLRFAL